MKARCICGCGRRAVQRHHAVYRQTLRWYDDGVRSRRRKTTELERDERNLVPVAHRCHERHHQRVAVLPLRVLPDSVFAFAVELMGAGGAYEYLARHYGGRDARLDALLVSDIQ